MTSILYRTRGSADPKGKPRVYFTCHPEDFDLYFDKLCRDIFKTHDVAVFYKEDMSAVIDPRDRETDLGGYNLFVVPVTFRLLSRSNAAMDSDIAYALKKHIPVLPFMMEQGINDFYEKKFGQRHYLCPYSEKMDGISYEDKLKKHLEAVLISDELAEKIRAEFAAYIFLSYRKMDRRYANALMKLIHSHPECRDIAVWFDEFLTPGEDFRTNIRKAMEKSRLFALLVTPNLLEEQNFVMREEYPAARASGKPILPAEMVKTDKGELSAKFKGIPACVDPHLQEFKTRLLEAVAVQNPANNDDPVHLYRIGLAYLEGIDVETDRKKGLQMLTAAADKALPEAMAKLYEVYEARGDYRKAGIWAKRMAKHCRDLYGAKHPETLEWLGNAAYISCCLGEYAKALVLQEKVYNLCCRELGNEHPKTAAALGNLAWMYDAVGDYARALNCCDELYTLRYNTLGEDHPDTLRALSYLAKTYCRFGENETALEFAEQVYAQRREQLGEEHPETLVSMNDLSVLYGDLRQYMTAVELAREAYALRCRISGEEHPETLTCLNNLALALSRFSKGSDEAMKKSRQVYTLRCKVLGRYHPNTLEALNNLALAYCDRYDFSEGQRLCQEALEQAEEKLGEAHPVTLNIMYNLAGICAVLGDTERQQELDERHDALSRNADAVSVPILEKIPQMLRSAAPETDIPEQLRAQSGLTLEPTHPSTRFWLNLLLKYRGSYETAQYVALLEKCCEIYELIYGAAHPLTMAKLQALLDGYSSVSAYEKELRLREKLCGLTGIEDLCGMASVYYRMGDHQKARQLYEKKLQEEPENSDALESLSLICDQMGDTETADRLLDRLLESDPGRIMFLNPRAEEYRSAGDYERSLRLYTRSYEYWRNALGEENIAVVAPLRNMAELCRLMGDTEKAGQLSEKAAISERRANAKVRLDALEKQVSATYGRDAVRERMELQEQIYDLRREAWGEEHPETVTALFKLVFDSYGCGEYRKSERLCKRLYVLQVKLDGREHPDTKATAKNLKAIWRTLGVCTFCGSPFDEKNVCTRCGKTKND